MASSLNSVEGWSLSTQLNRLLLTVPSMTELASQLTTFFIEIPGIAAVWFAHQEQHQDVVLPYAFAGKGMDRYLEDRRVLLSDEPESALARAWSSREVEVLSRDAEGGLEYWPLRELKLGWRSCCAVPLTGSSEPRDALVLYSAEPDFFSQPEIQNVVHHLHGALGFTVDRLRLVESLKDQQHTLKQAISENVRTNALHRALMSAAELIVRAQTERELLDELCRLLVKSGLFCQAWIGRPNISGNLEIQSIFSTAGMHAPTCLPNVYTDDEETVLAVRAWRQAQLQYSNDRLKNPARADIQNFYMQHGLRSIAVLPLYRDGDLWALLTLLSTEPDIFHPEMIDLLERIGRLAGHGLDAIDLRQILEEERQHQAWLARHDALTDILNRRGVVERLEEALSRARRHKKLLAVAVMDLEGFKAINDLHGHPAGDLLLRTMADRLQLTLRQSDAVGRLGSDEFVLILEDLEQEDDLTRMLSRVQAVVEDPVHLANGRTAIVRSYIGVTLFPPDDSSAERLLRHADRALDALKENKTESAQRWMIFQAEADQQKYVRQKTILSLFRSGNLRVNYQPVIDLQSGRVSGIEALARLVSSNGTILSPAEFLPQLTEADLITLTHQVMTQSIQDLHRLDAAGFSLNVGINFEPTMLADSQAMRDIRLQVESSGLAPHRIILELLERNDTLSLSSSQQVLRELKVCGVRIALDDVGSAYSSLLRVKELPADIIKLDRSFLIGLERQPKELRFILNLVHLAQALGLGLVAEGIECPASADALAALGVKLAQGYSIARPMPIEDLQLWLERYHPVSWERPTSVLGAVALQLRDLDASGRILEQRPSFLQHLLTRDADWEREIGMSIRQSGPGASRLNAAHTAWHQTMASLLSEQDGHVNLSAFQSARSAYEEEMFQAALVNELHS